MSYPPPNDPSQYASNQPNPYGNYPPPAGNLPVAYGSAQPASNHPVQLSIQRAEHYSRVLALFSLPFFFIRFVILIPALFVLYFVGIAMYFVAWIAQWAILFTGSYPPGMHSFVTGVLRWQTRASAYLYGLTNVYPPFTTSP